MCDVPGLFSLNAEKVRRHKCGNHKSEPFCFLLRGRQTRDQLLWKMLRKWVVRNSDPCGSENEADLGQAVARDEKGCRSSHGLSVSHRFSERRRVRL
ncbi:hypothetical protein TNCV_288381 [Trichonephila clavipes]|nr:hypothetical protein TNCV_288381 [Trichonephila clavipes]